MLLLRIKQFFPIIIWFALVFVCAEWYNLHEIHEITKEQLTKALVENQNYIKQSEKTNKELEANSRKIQGLINNANKTSENLKSILKNNQCANTPMPNDAINILRNKGISTNKAADTSKSDTTKRSQATKQ